MERNPAFGKISGQRLNKNMASGSQVFTGVDTDRVQQSREIPCPARAVIAAGDEEILGYHQKVRNHGQFLVITQEEEIWIFVAGQSINHPTIF